VIEVHYYDESSGLDLAGAVVETQKLDLDYTQKMGWVHCGIWQTAQARSDGKAPMKVDHINIFDQPEMAQDAVTDTNGDVVTERQIVPATYDFTETFIDSGKIANVAAEEWLAANATWIMPA